MQVKCKYNLGANLRRYELKPLDKEMMGRFGATCYSEYNELEIDKEYLVMGIIIFETYQAYLIDDNEFISACPCQLFDLVDDKIPSSWHFRLIDKGHNNYPFIQAIIGYDELCFDKDAYEKLIIEKDSISENIYFTRKKNSKID